MGIQINGNTDNISATDGGLTVSDLEINQSGVSTFNNALNIGTGSSIFSPATNTLTLGTNSAERLRIASNGSVSINYAGTGDNTLHIGNTSSAGGIIIKSPGDHYSNMVVDSNRSGANNGIFNLAGRWNGNDVAYISFTTGSDTTNKDDGYIRMYTRESGQSLTERLRIATDGKVGINQDTPQALLSLGGTVDAQKMLLYDNDGAPNEKYGFGIQSNELRQFAGGSANLTFGHISSSDGSTYSEKVRIKSTGELLVGTPNLINTSPSKFQVASNDATGSAIFARFNASVYSSYLDFYKSRNNTIGSVTVVNSDDHLGSIRFYGADGSNSGYTTAAEIYGSCDGGSSASGDMPGRITFHTRPDGAGQSMKERLRITASGIVRFNDNQGTYTNTVQSHSGESGFITHYTARTTSGADLYRRMLDIASGGANPHGSSIRFLTSNDNSNPATCVERMRILNDGGVFIGNKTHNQRYPHIESPALLTVQNGARVYPGSGVYAAPKGGFCDHARYELEQKLISISNSNLNIIQARNGQPVTINDARGGWSFYSNLPNYLLGHAATDNINNSSFNLTLYANMTVFLLRTNSWNSVPLTGWNLIEQNTNIAPASADTRLYVKSMAAGTYTNFDNDSAMYFFVL